MGRIAVRFGLDAIVVAGALACVIFVVFELLASGFLRGSDAARSLSGWLRPRLLGRRR